MVAVAMVAVAAVGGGGRVAMVAVAAVVGF